MQTQLASKQLWYQVPHTQPLPVPMHTVLENDQRDTEGETPMTKEEALQEMMLLSALESWAFSQSARLPDYLVENIQRSLEVLERVVLEKP